jgi:hypothetical protein
MEISSAGGQAGPWGSMVVLDGGIVLGVDVFNEGISDLSDIFIQFSVYQ